jgi:hypothetical protein
MKLTVRAIAVIGPGLDDWPQAAAVLRGDAPWSFAPTAVPAATRLPPAERRRVPLSVKLALAVADQVFASAPDDAVRLATVFTSSGGDGENCHVLCEALASDDPQLSPTRFTNSVHNAPAGYWSIASGATAPSSSLCAHDGSFAAGLFEAAVHALAEDEPVALIAYDAPYPEPLHAKRPILAPLGIGLVLAPGHAAGGLAHLVLGAHARGDADALALSGLDALRTGIPAARGLSLLEAVARREQRAIALEATDGQVLHVEVRPCA